MGMTIKSNISKVDLGAVENRYWKQFTAMEKAIQKANSQSTYLAGMFSQVNK